MTTFLRNILIILTSLVILIGILIVGILWSYSNDIPDYKFLNDVLKVRQDRYSSNFKSINDL